MPDDGTAATQLAFRAAVLARVTDLGEDDDAPIGLPPGGTPGLFLRGDRTWQTPPAGPYIAQAGRAVADLFRYAGGSLVLWREDRPVGASYGGASGAESYWFGRQISPSEFDCYEVTNVASGFTPGISCFALEGNDARQAVAGVIMTDPSVTSTGAWTTTPDTAAYSNAYTRSNAAGASKSHAPPNSADKMYARALLFSNGGYGVVTATVNGAAIDLPLLPTAAQEVAAGRMPATALVANGGPLNATDRVLSCFNGGTTQSAVHDVLVPIADGLTVGVSKSFTVTVVGDVKAMPVGSSDTRVYLGGFGYHDAGTAFVGNSVRQVVTSIPLGNAAIALNGAHWSAAQSDGNAYNGGYQRNGTPGESVVISGASLTAADALYVHALQFTNGGYAVATLTVGGNAVDCNRLPTAAQEVAAGRMAPGAIAAGGVLNPGDRVLLCYGNPINHDALTVVADGLSTTAAKVLTLTVTSVPPIGSTDTRLYLSGAGYHDASSIAANASERGVIARHQPLLSNYELAIIATPTGQTNNAFSGGHQHGYQRGDSMKLYVDGQQVELANGASLAGSSVVMVSTSTLLSAADGVTEFARVSTVYRISDRGFETVMTLQWLLSGALTGASYFGQYPRAKSWARCKNVALFTPQTAADNNDTVKSDAASDTMLVWQPGAPPGGAFGGMVQLTDPAGSWKGFPAVPVVTGGVEKNGGPVKMGYADRTNSINKVYPMRADASCPEPFAAGDTWRFEVLYAAQRFDCPENVLAML